MFGDHLENKKKRRARRSRERRKIWRRRCQSNDIVVVKSSNKINNLVDYSVEIAKHSTNTVILPHILRQNSTLLLHLPFSYAGRHYGPHFLSSTNFRKRCESWLLQCSDCTSLFSANLFLVLFLHTVPPIQSILEEILRKQNDRKYQVGTTNSSYQILFCSQCSTVTSSNQKRATTVEELIMILAYIAEKRKTTL